MTDDLWTERLSEYLDGEMSAQARAELERHLGECTECSATLDELRGVVAAAARLGALPPEHDLWPGIADRIGAGTQRRDVLTPARGRRPLGWFVSLPQLAAASVVLVAVSVAVTSVALRPAAPRGGASSGIAVSAPETSTGSTWASAAFDTGETAAAIAALERELSSNRGRFDPETIRVLEYNLAVIDAAIGEARAALAADPASEYLNIHVAQTLRRKVKLLQDAQEVLALSL